MWIEAGWIEWKLKGWSVRREEFCCDRNVERRIDWWKGGSVERKMNKLWKLEDSDDGRGREKNDFRSLPSFSLSFNLSFSLFLSLSLSLSSTLGSIPSFHHPIHSIHSQYKVNVRKSSVNWTRVQQLWLPFFSLRTSIFFNFQNKRRREWKERRKEEKKNHKLTHIRCEG